jgi:curved DNA-binding protein CbpA
MSDATTDPYSVLGISPDASDGELRRAYRELVKRHHPDHNGGSHESTVRFARIQNAYAVVAESRRSGHSASRPAPEPTVTGFGSSDPNIEGRIANLEQELAQMRAQEQRQAQEQARQAAARQAAAAASAAKQAAAASAAKQSAAAAAAQAGRPTDEELGYYTTDDSFTKIIDDATEKIADRVRSSDAKRQFAQRLADLFGRGPR